MTATETAQLDRLKAENTSLRQQMAEYEQTLSQKDSQLSQKEAHITHIEEQLAWFKQQLFGQRSERVVADLDQEQIELPGFETPKTVLEETKKQVASHERKKPNRNGQDKISLHPDLPVETVVIDLPEEQKKDLKKIGETVSHKLAHKPGSYYIKEIILPKYALDGGVVSGDLPLCILPKCQADNSLLAELVTQKFTDHLPLYRIVEIMGRSGVKISRKLLSQWVVKIGRALKPLYNEMLKRTLESNMIFIDETPIKIQDKKKCKQGYMWVVASEDPAYRVYHFRSSRNHEHVNTLLKGYHGHLHSDKYGAYEKLAAQKQIIWHPCMAHIRRKFYEAQTDPPFREWILGKIQALFAIEQKAWELDPVARVDLRQQESVPIIDELIEAVKEKLKDRKVIPKSKLREALGYFCGLIPYLKNYVDHPFARMDNNTAERAIRPLAIGRKNWLFFGSEDGAEAGAILYSLVQSCRSLEVNPREYLEDVFGRLLDHSSSKLDELLPDYWKKEQANKSRQGA